MPKLTLAEIAKIAGGTLKGDPTKTARSIRGLSTATGYDISFCYNKKYLPELRRSKAGCIIVTKELSSGIKGNKIIVDDVESALVALCRAMYPRENRSGISPKASLSADARIADGVYIGDHAVIEDGVSVGERTEIYPGAFIGNGTKIGSGCVIGPNVVIYHGTIIHDNVSIHAGTVIGSDGFGYTRKDMTKMPHVGIVEIESNVEIGSNCTIDRAKFDRTLIGEGTKLDNQVHVAHNVIIGKKCLILGHSSISGSCVIGNNVILTGQAGVADNVTIGDNCVLLMRPGVTKDVPAGKVLAGTPAMDKDKYFKLVATMRRQAERSTANPKPRRRSPSR